MRTSPQSKRDRHAWPVTIRVLVPEGGFHVLGRDSQPEAWLRRELGKGEFATTPRRSVIGDAVEFHFRSLEGARRFCEHYPMLELADETAGPLWWSPELPHGRRR